MTVQVTGAPDWTSVAPWKSLNLFSALGTVYPPGVTSLPVTPSLAFSAIQIKFVCASGGGHFVLHWYADAAGTQEVGNDLWIVSPTNFLLVSMPAEGPYFSIHVNNTGAGNLTATNWAMLSNEPVTRPTYPVTTSTIYGIGVAVNASTSIHNQFGHFTKGRAHLRVNPADATGKLNAFVESVDENGNVLGVPISVKAFTAQQDVEFPWPDDSLRFTVTNTDAGAPHTLDYALWVSDDV